MIKGRGNNSKYFELDNQCNIAFDVDQTLVVWGDSPYMPGPGLVEFNNNGTPVFLAPHPFHVWLLKNHAARGYGVLVWSAAGFDWAKEVVSVLGLTNYVNIIMPKLNKFVDDLPAHEILGEHLYFHNELTGEEWRPVKDYEGLYEVSDYGRIRKVNKDGSFEIKRLSNNGLGYLTTGLYKNGKNTTKLVHRLVAEAFVPNPHRHAVVNHIDHNPQNPKAKNLEWTTTKRNNQHANRSSKRHSRGANNPGAKISEADARQIYLSKRPAKELAASYGITKTAVYYIKNGTSWGHIHAQHKETSNGR